MRPQKNASLRVHRANILRVFVGLIFVLPVVTCLITGCHSNASKELGVLSMEDMAKIISELKIVDAAYQAGISPIGTPSDSLLNSLDSTRLDSLNQKSLAEVDSSAAVEFGKRMSSKLKQGSANPNPSIDSAALSLQDSIEMRMLEDYKPDIDGEGKTHPTVYAGHVGADYDYIFTQYNTTRAVFEKSLTYYALHPKQLEKILERTLDLLLELQATLNDTRRSEFSNPTQNNMIPNL